MVHESTLALSSVKLSGTKQLLLRCWPCWGQRPISGELAGRSQHHPNSGRCAQCWEDATRCRVVLGRACGSVGPLSLPNLPKSWQGLPNRRPPGQTEPTYPPVKICFPVENLRGRVDLWPRRGSSGPALGRESVDPALREIPQPPPPRKSQRQWMSPSRLQAPRTPRSSTPWACRTTPATRATAPRSPATMSLWRWAPAASSRARRVASTPAPWSAVCRPRLGVVMLGAHHAVPFSKSSAKALTRAKGWGKLPRGCCQQGCPGRLWASASSPEHLSGEVLAKSESWGKFRRSSTKSTDQPRHSCSGPRGQGWRALRLAGSASGSRGRSSARQTRSECRLALALYGRPDGAAAALLSEIVPCAHVLQVRWERPELSRLRLGGVYSLSLRARIAIEWRKVGLMRPWGRPSASDRHGRGRMSLW